MSERRVTRYISLAAMALAVVAMALAVWDLFAQRAGNPRDSIRIMLLAAAVLFVAGASLRRRVQRTGRSGGRSPGGERDEV